MKRKKTTNCLLRLSEKDNQVLTHKATILNISKSELLRTGGLSWWDHTIGLNEKVLRLYAESGDNEKEFLVNMLTEHYKRVGYPHNFLSSEKLQKEMIKLSKTKSPLLEDDNLQRNTIGLNIANHFHPHMVKVKCTGNYRTPYEQYEDEHLLHDSIKRWLSIGKKPSPAGLRRILRTRDGVRSVVNFKPAISKYIYDTYCPISGKTLDPCSGYSGRLSGAIASNRGIWYHGIDPDGRTAVGNMKCAAFFSKQYDLMDRKWKFGFRFDLGCAEEIMPTIQDSYDLIFSSPPFFNVEKYSKMPNQSYIKFPEYKKWLDGFLRVIIKESYRLLKIGGHLILNLKNYKKEPIADDSIGLAKEFGFVLEKTYKMRLSNLEYNIKKEEKTWHFEPIIVFTKD